MKYSFMLVCFLSVYFFTACGNGETSSAQGEGSAATAIDMDGPKIEFNVISFDADANRTHVEIINRMDDDIREIRGRFFFLDKNGNNLTTATGRDLSSPFQRVENPSIVQSRSKSSINFMDNVPENTKSIRVGEFRVTTTGGETLEVEL